MDTIEAKVHKLQELSKKQKKLDEIKQDIADILWGADSEEKKKIAEKMSKTPVEDINQKRNLQFIVPHVVKELYEHNGPKGSFVVPLKKIEPVKPIEEEETIPEEETEEIIEEKEKKTSKIKKTKEKIKNIKTKTKERYKERQKKAKEIKETKENLKKIQEEKKILQKQLEEAEREEKEKKEKENLPVQEDETETLWETTPITEDTEAETKNTKEKKKSIFSLKRILEKIKKPKIQRPKKIKKEKPEIIQKEEETKESEDTEKNILVQENEIEKQETPRETKPETNPEVIEDETSKEKDTQIQEDNSEIETPIINIEQNLPKPYAPVWENIRLNKNLYEFTDKRGLIFKIGEEVTYITTDKKREYHWKITGFNGGKEKWDSCFIYTEKSNQDTDQRPTNVECFEHATPEEIEKNKIK
jgi:myosin heavy subunit